MCHLTIIGMSHQDMHHIVGFIGLGKICDENKEWLINQQNTVIIALVINTFPTQWIRNAGSVYMLWHHHTYIQMHLFRRETLLLWITCNFLMLYIIPKCFLPCTIKLITITSQQSLFSDPVDYTIGYVFQSFFGLIRKYHRRLHYWSIVWVSQGSDSIVDSVSISWRLHAYEIS